MALRRQEEGAKQQIEASLQRSKSAAETELRSRGWTDKEIVARFKKLSERARKRSKKEFKKPSNRCTRKAPESMRRPPLRSTFSFTCRCACRTCPSLKFDAAFALAAGAPQAGTPHVQGRRNQE